MHSKLEVMWQLLMWQLQFLTAGFQRLPENQYRMISDKSDKNIIEQKQ